jgi:2-polyprenyl-3-methyl-5-hydroxy-6-metoxy-1,4-benzoquinol methylase
VTRGIDEQPHPTEIDHDFVILTGGMTDSPNNTVPDDRAGMSYWDSLWSDAKKKRAVGDRPLDYSHQQLANAFEKAFEHIDAGNEKRLVEIGCGDSAWLPYFARHFAVSGLDYSPAGCDSASALLTTRGIEAEIVCADLFSPPDSMVEAFDAVVSIGVIEHFEDTASVLRAIGRFVKPSGVIVTMIPNMTGLMGRIQKLVNQPVYDIHVPLDQPALVEAHRAAGLNLIDCHYLMGFNLMVINTRNARAGFVGRTLRKFLFYGFLAVSKAVWAVERFAGPFPGTKRWSPLLIAVARSGQGASA